MNPTHFSHSTGRCITDVLQKCGKQGTDSQAHNLSNLHNSVAGHKTGRSKQENMLRLQDWGMSAGCIHHQISSMHGHGWITKKNNNNNK